MKRKVERGFTLMEVLVAILVIFMLMGLLIAGIHHVRKSGKGARDKAIVTSLNLGVSNFNREFGFLPPLVKDFDMVGSNGPIAQPSTGNKVKIYSVSGEGAFMRTNRPGPPSQQTYQPAQPYERPQDLDDTPQSLFDVRFSQFSLPYFVAGALEIARSNGDPLPLDGVEGPGFLTPKRDGTFEKSGRRFESFFDLSRNGKALATIDLATGKVVVRDANDVPLRYYRWLQGESANNNQVTSPDHCNVPIILGRAKENPELRSATYAIVGAGPDGVFGDEADFGTDSTDPFVGPWTLARTAVGMTWADLASKVGRPPPATPEDQQRIRNLARKDNVIAVGAAK